MANYKETSVAGSSYVRSDRVEIFNDQEQKSITFSEVKVTTIEGGASITQPFDAISAVMNSENSGTEFPVLDPVDGSETGASMSYAELYAGMYSLYLYLANLRDAGISTAPSEADAIDPPSVDNGPAPE